MVDSSEAVMSATPQAADTSEVVSAACPLSNFSQEAHQYIHSLEARIAKLESEQQSSRERMISFGKMLYSNPMTKMMLSSAPKEIQNRVKEFFDGSH